MPVTDIINASQARADQALLDADLYLEEIAEIAREDQLNIKGNWVLTPWLYWLYDHVDIPQPAAVNYAGPTLNDLSAFVRPTVPTVSDPTLPATWTNDSIPEFTAQPPVLDIPEKPEVPLPTVPGVYSVKDVSVLDWLDKAFPDDPVLNESPLPTPDELNVMEVDFSLPVNNLTTPENTFAFVETDYSSALLDSLRGLLASDLENGGYGIEPLDEQLLFERARDREIKQGNVNVRQIRERTAARKFPVPPGFLYEAEQQEVQRAAGALSELNREILLQRSERYVQARQFAIQQGLSLENALLSYQGSKEERALRAAQATVELSIKVHQAAVALFELDVAIRRLYRDLHAEHLQTVITKVEEYRMKLQHSQAEDERNKTRVQLYSQLLSAVKLYYDAQIARDQRTKIEVEIETLKLRQSQEEVQLYVAQHNGRRAAFDAYATEVKGESLKLDLFQNQIQAHQQQVDTVTKTSGLKRDLFEAEMKKLVEQRQYINLRLQGIETELRAAVAEADQFAKDNNEDISIWKAGLDAQQFNSRIAYERNVSLVEVYQAATRINTDHLVGAMGVINNYNELKAKAAQSAIGLYESHIAAAESALSAVASMAEAT